MILVGAAVAVLFPQGAISVALTFAVAGVLAAMLWPVDHWSREDRLMSFALVAAFLLIGAARLATAEGVGPLERLLPIAPLLLTPMIILLARCASVRGPAVTAAVLAGFLLASRTLIDVEFGELIPDNPPMGPIAVGAIGLALLIGIPLRQFAWGFSHPGRRIRYLSYAAWVVMLVAVPSLMLAMHRGHAGSVAVAAMLIALLWGVMRAEETAFLSAPRARKETLSVTIICKDEADRIDKLLDAVHGWADEIVVLDSGSTDDTVTIARRVRSISATATGSCRWMPTRCPASSCCARSTWYSTVGAATTLTASPGSASCSMDRCTSARTGGCTCGCSDVRDRPGSTVPRCTRGWWMLVVCARCTVGWITTPSVTLSMCDGSSANTPVSRPRSGISEVSVRPMSVRWSGAA